MEVEQIVFRGKEFDSLGKLKKEWLTINVTPKLHRLSVMECGYFFFYLSLVPQ